MSYYDFVPVDSTLRTVVSPESRKKLESVFLLEPAFKLKTELHVSSGAKKVVKRNNRLEIILLHYKNSQGLPVVPASSFKGAISTNFLALTGNAEMTANLFGATRKSALISKVFFSDLKTERKELKEVEILRQWEPHTKRGKHVKFYIRKMPKTAKYGFMECIPAGSILRGKVIGYNLNDLELGGLIMAMGFGLENAILKMGYGKPQGFGQMIPLEMKVFKIALDHFELRKTEVDPKTYIENFRAKFKDRISSFGKTIFAGV